MYNLHTVCKSAHVNGALDTLGIVEFLFLQFTPIPLVYLKIEKNNKIPPVNVHRVKYEQFPNLIDKIHFLQISILPSLILQICPVYHI